MESTPSDVESQVRHRVRINPDDDFNSDLWCPESQTPPPWCQRCRGRNQRWGIEIKEIYKGKTKVDNNQTNLYFIQHLRTLPSQLLQLQLTGKFWEQKIVYWLILLSPLCIFLPSQMLLLFEWVRSKSQICVPQSPGQMLYDSCDSLMTA